MTRLHFRSLSLVLASLFALCAAGPSVAIEPDWDQLFETDYAEGTFLSIGRNLQDEPVLIVRYPWKTHAMPSIEIRQLVENDAREELIRPLFFVRNGMWEQTKVEIHQARERANEIQKVKKVKAYFPRKIFQLELVSETNSIGAGAAALAMSERTEEEGKEWVSRAVFPLLEDWAPDERTLYLDLPKEYFREPMKLRVWMLGYASINWTETIDWPGYEPDSKAAAAVAPADASAEVDSVFGR